MPDVSPRFKAWNLAARWGELERDVSAMYSRALDVRMNADLLSGELASEAEALIGKVDDFMNRIYRERDAARKAEVDRA